jgi:exopolysaccharide biosynthesis polyprenyl glycosylphosphotransferase
MPAKVSFFPVDKTTKSKEKERPPRVDIMAHVGFRQAGGAVFNARTIHSDRIRGYQMGAKYDRLRKLVWFIGGWSGAMILSAAALVSAVIVTGCEPAIAYEMLSTLTLIRVVLSIVRGNNKFLCTRSIRTRPAYIFKDEGLVSVFFLAGAYILQWREVQTTVAVFLGINLLFQTALWFVCKRMLQILKRPGENWTALHGKHHVIVVGTGTRAQGIVDSILASPEMDISVKGFLDYHKVGLWRYRDIPLLGHPDRLRQISATSQVDAVILATEAEDAPRTQQLLAECDNMGIPVCLVAGLQPLTLAKARPSYLNGTPVLVYQTAPTEHGPLMLKNLLDKVGALIGLILSAPLLLAAAVAIKLDSKGPVLFKQKRCGLNGRQFSLYKLRTMCPDAEKKKDQVRALNMMSGPVFKAKKDPRVTRVGRYLRKWSIDEIPQFLNVLRGDMSLVGPRPPLPEEVAQYEPWQRRRLSVKPGVTCLWQVNGRNNVDFEEWMRLDLQYIDNWSPWLDAKILAKTVPAVLKGTGAS